MNEAMTVPAASLLRVSTAAQAADGTSLETQSRANREFISARGWAVAGEYVEREGVSGAAEERGDVDRLLRDIRAGLVQVVVVNKVDRFVRDARQFHNTIAEIEGAGALFVSATEGFDGSTASGRMHRSMLAVIAAFERDRIRERTQDGVRETARMGFWPGGEPRFGLRTVKDRSTKHKRVVLHRAEAATVRAAVGLLVDEGLDFTEAAARLNALGHAPRRAGRWNAALPRAALSGEGLCGSWTYAGGKPGRRAPKGEPITISVPEVLTPERHAALAEVLRATSRRVGPSGFYLLSRGRLASPCGERYHGTARNDRHVRAYRCAASGRGCGCRRLDAAQVEDAVWGAVVDLLSHPERLLASAEEHLAERGRRLGVEREEAVKVEARMAEVQRALTTTIRDYAKQGLPAEALAAATSELQEELEALRSHRGELARWERADLAEAARSKSLWKVARVAADRLRDMPAEDRDRVLELLQVRVEVEGWDDCAACEGRGKLPGRRGGYRCDRCRGLRQIATVHVQGVFIERLGDVLAGSPVRHFGNDRSAAASATERDENGKARMPSSVTALASPAIPKIAATTNQTVRHPSVASNRLGPSAVTIAAPVIPPAMPKPSYGVVSSVSLAIPPILVSPRPDYRRQTRRRVTRLSPERVTRRTGGRPYRARCRGTQKEERMRRCLVRVAVVVAVAASLLMTPSAPARASTNGSLTVIGSAAIGNGIAYPCLDGKSSPASVNLAKCGGFLTGANFAAVGFSGSAVGLIENLNKAKCGSLPFSCVEAGVFTINATGLVRGACSLGSGALTGTITPTLGAGTKAKSRGFSLTFLWVGEEWVITGTTTKGETLAGDWDIKAFIAGTCGNKSPKLVAITGALNITRV